MACRYCLDDSGELVSPCPCRGSLALVHAACVRDYYVQHALGAVFTTMELVAESTQRRQSLKLIGYTTNFTSEASSSLAESVFVEFQLS